jgi:hypothetical protein
MLTSGFRRETLKAGGMQEDRSGYSATGLSSGSVEQEIED